MFSLNQGGAFECSDAVLTSALDIKVIDALEMQSVPVIVPGAYMDIAMSGHGFFEAAYEAEKLG